MLSSGGSWPRLGNCGPHRGGDWPWASNEDIVKFLLTSQSLFLTLCLCLSFLSIPNSSYSEVVRPWTVLFFFTPLQVFECELIQMMVSELPSCRLLFSTPSLSVCPCFMLRCHLSYLLYLFPWKRPLSRLIGCFLRCSLFLLSRVFFPCCQLVQFLQGFCSPSIK